MEKGAFKHVSAYWCLDAAHVAPLLTGDCRPHTMEALVGFQGLILTCVSETLNSFLRPLKNNDFKEDTERKNRVYDIVKSTTLESNKSLASYAHHCRFTRP